MARRIVCQLCGATFICHAGEKDCWCGHIALTPEATDELRKRAKDKDCVCQRCLTELAFGKPSDND